MDPPEDEFAGFWIFSHLEVNSIGVQILIQTLDCSILGFIHIFEKKYTSWGNVLNSWIQSSCAGEYRTNHWTEWTKLF